MSQSSTEKTVTLCVFCGSSGGTSTRYEEGVKELAHEICANSWSVIYGGGSLGLMGTLAQSIVKVQGPTSVLGIIPSAFLQGGITTDMPYVNQFGHTMVVSTMHERKRHMVDRSDAFVALPGGYGTMEELLEITTWNQLGIHDRPVLVFNIDGYFDEILQWIRKGVNEGFIPKDQADIIYEAKTAREVVEGIQNYKGAQASYKFLKWSNDVHMDKDGI